MTFMKYKLILSIYVDRNIKKTCSTIFPEHNKDTPMHKLSGSWSALKKEAKVTVL